MCNCTYQSSKSKQSKVWKFSVVLNHFNLHFHFMKFLCFSFSFWAKGFFNFSTHLYIPYLIFNQISQLKFAFPFKYIFMFAKIYFKGDFFGWRLQSIAPFSSPRVSQCVTLLRTTCPFRYLRWHLSLYYSIRLASSPMKFSMIISKMQLSSCGYSDWKLGAWCLVWQAKGNSFQHQNSELAPAQ